LAAVIIERTILGIEAMKIHRYDIALLASGLLQMSGLSSEHTNVFASFDTVLHTSDVYWVSPL
jgi:hypothetical protein